MRTVVALMGLALSGVTLPAMAQEGGWHYSPLPGEGDRAAMGCSAGSTPDRHSCLVVRCEDDFSTALYIHTSRAGGDAGRWTLQFDREAEAVNVEAEPSAPYGARILGDVLPLITLIEQSGLVYLDPADDAPIERQIGLGGSLAAIHRALFFCAPPAKP